MKKQTDPCVGCEVRVVGCHGKDKDGNWRCLRWKEVQEKKQAEMEKTLPLIQAAKIGKDYKSESRTRMLRKKQRGH